LLEIIKTEKPDTIVHFAEQRAAPYSMKTSAHKRYTVENNLSATNNILAAIVESEMPIHLVHLGTMGVYGYGTAGMKIPEGYLEVNVKIDDDKEVAQEILYPANPGSIYHMTKTQDALLFFFYNKNDQVRITVFDASRCRLSTQRARHGWSDARLHPHQGHRSLYRAGHRESAAGR